MENKEYEVQHFKFSATQVSLERSHLLKKVVTNAVDLMLDKIIEFTKDPETYNELKQEAQNVHKSIMGSLEEPLKELDKLDCKYFTIPDHVLLPNDFHMIKDYTPSQEKYLDEELDELRKTFLENSFMIQALKEENEKYLTLHLLLDEELTLHSQVQNAINAVNVEKIKDAANATLSLTDYL